MLEAIFGIVGVVIGFLFSEGATRIREHETERKQARSVRLLIGLEIDRNLNLLQVFWDKVISTDVSDPELRSKALALKFIEYPMPRWQTEGLNSQLPHLAMALLEEEIVAVLKFQERLDLLVKLREELLKSARGTIQSYGIGRETILPDAIDFVQKVPSYWDQCERIVTEIQRDGNPLQSRGARITK